MEMYAKFVSEEKKDVPTLDIRNIRVEQRVGAESKTRFLTAFLKDGIFKKKDGTPVEGSIIPENCVTGEEYKFIYYEKENEYQGKKRVDYICLGIYTITDEEKKKAMQTYSETGLPPSAVQMLEDIKTKVDAIHDLVLK